MYQWTYSDEELHRAIQRGRHERALAFGAGVSHATIGATIGIERLILAPLGAALWLLRALRTRLTRSRAIGELQRLDDRMLKDIGIGRGEIASVVESLASPESDDRIVRGRESDVPRLRGRDPASRVPFVRPLERPASDGPASNDNESREPLGHAQPRTACG